MSIFYCVAYNLTSGFLWCRFYNDSTSNCIKEAKNVKLMFVSRLYMYLQTGGWSIILLSREPRTHRNVTINHLDSAGLRSWSALMMRYGDHVPFIYPRSSLVIFNMFGLDLTFPKSRGKSKQQIVASTFLIFHHDFWVPKSILVAIQTC